MSTQRFSIGDTVYFFDPYENVVRSGRVARIDSANHALDFEARDEWAGVCTVDACRTPEEARSLAHRIMAVFPQRMEMV